MMILNPLSHSLFSSLVCTFAALLGLGLSAISIAVSSKHESLFGNVLFLRWLSWALIAPITIFSVLSGAVPIACLTALITSIAVIEFCRITGRTRAEKLVLLIVSALMPLAALVSAKLLPVIAILAFMILALACMVKGSNFENFCLSLAGLIYLPVFASYAVFLDKIDAIGPALLISVISASALSNIFAFVFGKIFGGLKLAENLSPNKTWTGALGSLAGAFCGFGIISKVTFLHMPAVLFVAIPLVVAIAGVLGDLFESMIKRSFKVKDAGSWLPGFGGALDRIDSLLFVLPLVYYLVKALL